MLFSKSINAIRFIGDASHVVATWILLFKLIHTRSASGISGKSQFLFALTYTFRYLDVWTIYISDYNTAVKCYYIIASWLICYFIWSEFAGKTYQRDKDTFRIEFLLVVVTLLAFTINHESTVLEVAWTWSIYMESVALIPQLYMIWTSRKVDSFVLFYVLGMAMYRGFYIGNWVYRYYNEEYYDFISIVGGCVETMVAFVGFLTILTVRLGNSSNPTLPSSIYLLPSMVEQFGKDYKILRNSNADAETERRDAVTQSSAILTNSLEGNRDCDNQSDRVHLV